MMTYLKNVIKETQLYFTYILKKKDLWGVLTLICAVDSSN